MIFSSRSVQFILNGSATFCLSVAISGCMPDRIGFVDSSQNGLATSAGVFDPTGSIVGALGNVTASSGTCPSGFSTTTYCTGGTFTALNADGGFSSPKSIAIDPTNGYFYVAVSFGNRLAKYTTATGTYLGSLGYTLGGGGNCRSGAGGTNAWCVGANFSSNSGDGGFNTPSSIVIDQSGTYLYVADSNNFRVSKFVAATGAYVGSIGYSSATSGTCPAAAVASGWCTGGSFATSTLDGGFNNVYNLAIDSANDFLYVANGFAIQKFVASTGAFIGSIGRVSATTGTCPSAAVATTWCTGGTFIVSSVDGGFSNVPVIAYDGGYLYAAHNARISKHVASTGTFVGSIGKTTASTGTCPSSGVATGWCTGGTFTTALTDGAFTSVGGMAINSANNTIYVTDAPKVQKFTLSTGIFVGALGKTTSSTGTCPSSGVASTWCTGGTFTTLNGDGGYNIPVGVSFDSGTGNLYVTDQATSRVMKLK